MNAMNARQTKKTWAEKVATAATARFLGAPEGRGFVRWEMARTVRAISGMVVVHHHPNRQADDTRPMFWVVRPKTLQRAIKRAEKAAMR